MAKSCHLEDLLGEATTPIKADKKLYIPAFINCLVEMTEPLPFIASAFLSVLNLYRFYLLMEIV